MSSTYAGILGSLAFILTLTRGLIDGSSPSGILWMATICLLVFAMLGYISGRVADQILWDALEKQFRDKMQAREAGAPRTEPHRG